MTLKYFICLGLYAASAITCWSQCNSLTWSDEFDGTTLDQSKWAYQTGDGCPNLCGWGNGELEYYTNGNNNLKVNNGILTLEAKKESQGGASFTSAKLVTLGKFSQTYGRFEARMRMPLGTGLWPAFWMLSVNNDWPMTGEIDIMEYRGDQPKTTNGTLHYGQPWPDNRYDASQYSQTADLSVDFHVYAVEWNANEIKWYLDNTLFKTETKSPSSLNPANNNSSQPWPWVSDFYIILNLAVGGGYTGNPSASQIQLTKPTFEIDYVRVYSSSGSGNTLSPSITGKNKIYTQDLETYSTQTYAGATYTWSVTGGGASIISGQNSPKVTIKNTSETTCSLQVLVKIPASSNCPEQTAKASKEVLALNDYCNFTFQDFEPTLHEASELKFTSGTATVVANPSISAPNTSAKVLKYTRSTTAYDIIFLDNTLLRNGSDYENGTYFFNLDVYSSSQPGTPIEIQVASSSAWNDTWPTGRHTVYRATTTKTNQWETLKFTLSLTGDPNRSKFDTTVDRLIILVNPNTTGTETYYLDNLRRNTTLTNTCLVSDIADQWTDTKIQVYPNPTNGIIYLENHAPNAAIKVYDLMGQQQWNLNTNDNMIDVGRLAKGFYFIEIKNVENHQIVKIQKN